MFSKWRLNIPAVSVSFQYTAWYFTIFISGTLIIFLIAFFSVKQAISKHDQALILNKLESYEQLFQQQNLFALNQRLKREQEGNHLLGYYVRLFDEQNRVLHLVLPQEWNRANAHQYLPARSTFKVGTFSQMANKPAEDSLLEKLEDLIVTYDEEMIEYTGVVLANGYALEVGKSLDDRHELVEYFQVAFLATGIPLVLFALISGILLTRRTMQPVKDLIQTVREVSAGSMTTRVPTRETEDELDELAQLFNQMLARIETLIKGMRAALDNVAHDLRTPITRMRVSIEQALANEQTVPALQEALLDCAEDTERIHTVLNTLMDISEAETGMMHLNISQVDLLTLAQEAIELYQYVAEEKNINIKLAPGSQSLLVAVDPARIRQVITNLLDNGIKYTPEGGSVTIGLAKDVHKKQAIVTIRDTGIGIEAEVIPKIFDRLYRGHLHLTQSGLGLGLSLVKPVLQAHQGDIIVQSRPGEGSKFILRLPLNQ